MTRSYETLVLQLLKLFRIILAFPSVLDDMETSRLASLHEPNLCGTQLVVVEMSTYAKKARMHMGDLTYASRRGSNDIRILGKKG
ncbi:hypothetical protein Tco_0753366 [Tanacetum coccineum]